jgi:hypothetical protein
MERHDPYDARGWKRGAQDMGQGNLYALPDEKCQFERDHMRGLGWQLFQDFQHRDKQHTTRWWFKSTWAWKKRIERIENMGYEAIDKLTNT